MIKDKPPGMSFFRSNLLIIRRFRHSIRASKTKGTVQGGGTQEDRITPKLSTKIVVRLSMN
jgi:hypothetical protein